MTLIRFTVPAVPVAQPRQRHTRSGRNYTPSDHPVQAFKATIRLAAKAEHSGAPLQGPIRMRCVFVMPRPGRLVWKTKPMPRLAHTSTPDVENIAKAVMDALSGTTFVDDAQVYALDVAKVIAGGDEQPHVTIEIEEIERCKPA